MSTTTTQHIEADGLKIFYRSAGLKDAPVLLLLHGFPSSSHQFRNLIPLLSHKYRVIAPDLPGYGFTEVPASRNYVYTFENIATSIGALLDVLKITKFSPYVFDYGGPTGFRLALQRPEAIQAIFTQNGNAYLAGLGEFWAPLQALWENDTPEQRLVIKNALLGYETTKWQYTNGSHGQPVAPEAPFLDSALMERPGNHQIQLDLFYDYRTNLPLYPLFQEYFRKSQVPLIAFWGKNDEIFVPAGAEAFKRDLPDAEIHLLDTGHFASETMTNVVGQLMLDFLARIGI
ncbi:hypothetical protein WAI453_010045 [Rhynchosporium graminicola]|uniref:Probable soluble epoxide hydrolase n=1 Tax=Rhynchosporium graminicola TaxID=2792576 RepID=A0A1E1KEX1_9HELO|nr:probable soluble epoxide hydrolase [Rhynchosporium commune]